MHDLRAMKTTDRILAFLGGWTEEMFGFSAVEIAVKLGLDRESTELALSGLEAAGLVVSTTHEGVVYYASERALVERALIRLVQRGKVTVERDPGGELRYRAVRRR